MRRLEADEPTGVNVRNAELLYADIDRALAAGVYRLEAMRVRLATIDRLRREQADEEEIAIVLHLLMEEDDDG